MEKSELDIIIPVFNESLNIFKNITYINDKLNSYGITPKFIIVNDGSTDYTWLEIVKLKEKINDLKGINLSKNFGKESAICAGLSETIGELVLVMDSDLQHPVEIIPEMLAIQKQGFKIVEGVKRSRGKERFFNKMAAKSFYKLINYLSGFKMDNATDFKLITKEVVDAWKSIGETNTFFRGMIEWVGFEKTQILFDVEERSGGESKFSTIKLFSLALNALTSFSSAPLFLTNLLSIIFFFGALILGIQTLYNKLSNIAQDGFSTVILLLLIIGSAILFCLGIIGTYISKIYDEVKKRPRFIVKDKI